MKKLLLKKAELNFNRAKRKIKKLQQQDIKDFDRIILHCAKEGERSACRRFIGEESSFKKYSPWQGLTLEEFDNLVTKRYRLMGFGTKSQIDWDGDFYIEVYF